MSTHREKRFVAPLPLLPFTLSSALDYRVLSKCSLAIVSRSKLGLLTNNGQLGMCLARLLERGHLIEQSLVTAKRRYIGYTLTRDGEVWMDRFFTEHGAALKILREGKL